MGEGHLLRTKMRWIKKGVDENEGKRLSIRREQKDEDDDDGTDRESSGEIQGHYHEKKKIIKKK